MPDHRVGPTTERLEHRAFELDDAEVVFALRSAPDILRYTGEPALQSVEEARRAIADYPDFDTVGYGRWACVLKESQTVIGFCGLKYLEELDAVDVGYRFLPEYWGQGLATEACAAAADFGFRVLSLERIIGLVVPENAASIRVLEKVGMRLNGPVLYDSEPALLYEIMRSDYEKASA